MHSNCGLFLTDTPPLRKLPDMTTRESLLHHIADAICALERPHPIRVGIDGLPASGKTTLADELVAPLEARGRPVIRATGDGFHHPREHRYQQGKTSPQGYYEDSFNHALLTESLLHPLGPDGNRLFRRARFNFRIDEEVDSPTELAESHHILVLDGLFLHRDTIRDHWDYSIFVHADFDVITERAMGRDLDFYGHTDRVRASFENRFIPGHKIYFDLDRPYHQADTVINNNDVHAPVITDPNTLQVAS